MATVATAIVFGCTFLFFLWLVITMSAREKEFVQAKAKGKHRK